MATKLDKDIIRESTIKINDREIIITLTETQEISMKLKGMKSGIVNINILDLYNQLTNNNESNDKPKQGSITIKNDIKIKSNNNKMISLNDLRSMNMISNLDYNTKAKFDGIINDLLENN